MRKAIYLSIAGIFFFCFPGMASAEFNPQGKWFLEGSGYAEKGFVRVKLKDKGELNVRTGLKDKVRYVTGYDVKVTLNASQFSINAWEYKANTTLRDPVKLPDADPTLDEPFELPSVTYDGLTYKVTFTSAASGTIDIYGPIGNGTEVNSASAVWKDGTEKPKVPKMSSGCDTGTGAAALFLAALVFARAYKKQT